MGRLLTIHGPRHRRHQGRELSAFHLVQAADHVDHTWHDRRQVPRYVAHVSVDPEEPIAGPAIQRYPGVPATMMIIKR